MSVKTSKTIAKPIFQYRHRVRYPTNVHHHSHRKSKVVDVIGPDKELSIDKMAIPFYINVVRKGDHSAVWLETIKLRLKESELYALCKARSHHYSGWAHEFGPLSEMMCTIRFPLKALCVNHLAYATGMGATQTAQQHVRSGNSAHMLSWD